MANSVTILEDVAKLAGVSKSTASRILAASVDAKVPYSDETKSKVRVAAARLGYRPSKLARGLSLAKTGIVGLVIPSLTDSFFPFVANDIEACLSQAGYSVILANSHADSETERARIEDLLSWRVDGLIIVPAQETGDAGLFWELSRRNFPFVLLDRSFPETPFGSVVTDDEAGAGMAVDHLVAGGWRRIALAGSALTISTNRLRHAGYQAALLRHGILPRPEYVLEVPCSEEGGAQALDRLLALDARPDAVFCLSDFAAYGMLEACERKGIRVPEDLAIVGYTDLPPSRLLKVTLTTIRQPRALLGRRAAEQLLSLLSGAGRPGSVSLPVELVIRESTTRKETSQASRPAGPGQAPAADGSA